MDYEKAYKEALERAQRILCNLPEGSTTIRDIESIFPELAESEDERIRKVIRQLLLGMREEIFTTQDEIVTKVKVLAYLEKQKRKNASIVEILTRAGLKPYKDGNKWCILAGDNIQEGICGFGDTVEEALYQFLIDVLNEQKKMRPAGWSEEDDKYRNGIIRNLEYLINMTSVGCVTRELRQRIEWLKSLRPQPKQPNLSDKEIVCLKRTLDYLRKEHNRYGGSDTDFTNEIAVLEWLITHPVLVYSSQPRWKPSEEQMEALDKAIPVCMGVAGREEVAPLESLYNQLKKL